jgi:hypothetical protein
VALLVSQLSGTGAINAQQCQCDSTSERILKGALDGEQLPPSKRYGDGEMTQYLPSRLQAPTGTRWFRTASARRPKSCIKRTSQGTRSTRKALLGRHTAIIRPPPLAYIHSDGTDIRARMEGRPRRTEHHVAQIEDNFPSF